MRTVEERNKAVVLRLKDEVSSRGRFEVMEEIAVPGFRPRRQAGHNLAQNAREQGFPEPGHQMRKAIPDRVDHIESIVAEGDRVGMRWRVKGTHEGNLFGIPATGRSIDIQSIGVFRVQEGRIADAWFMADEVELLQQLGCGLPKRKDGKTVYVPTLDAGDERAALLSRLDAEAVKSEQQRNKMAAVRGSLEIPGLVTAVSFPDRPDGFDCLMAEGDAVWMHFKLCGRHG